MHECNIFRFSHSEYFEGHLESNAYIFIPRQGIEMKQNTKYSSECVLHFYTSLFHIISSFETILPVLNEFHTCQFRTLQGVPELFACSSLNLFIACEMNSFDMFLETCNQQEVRWCQIWATGKAWNNLKFNVLLLKWQ